MARSLAPAVRALALLSMLVSASAWLGSTLTVAGPGATDRSPALVFAPNVRTAARLPVILLLHGRCQGALGADAYFHFANLVDQSNFVLVVPEATRSQGGCAACSAGLLGAATCRPWAATPACCATRPATAAANWTAVDDSTYLMSVLAQLKTKYAVDEQRIFIAGHESGGFMAYRMACDHPETFAAIMSLNGAMFANASQCSAFRGSSPVSVLEVHGKADDVVPYVGGTFEGKPVPGALASATMWAQHDGCGAPVKAASRELLRHGPFFMGTDTDVLTFPGCSGGSGVSLWTVNDLGADVDGTTFTNEFARDVVEFFTLHPKGGAAAPAPAATGGLTVEQFGAALSPAPAPRSAAAPAPAAARQTLLQTLIAGAARSPPPPPSPPRPPTLLSLIRTAIEARDAPPASRAPAPAPARARSLAPAPAPAAGAAALAAAPAPASAGMSVNSMSGPPAADEVVTALSGPPPAADTAVPTAGAPPPAAAVQPTPTAPPASATPSESISAEELMSVLSNREALQSLIGAGLASNMLLPANIKEQLANPAVQAVLTAAAASPNPAKYIMDALNAAGVDVTALLGTAGIRVAAAPAPAPSGMDKRELTTFALQPPPPRSSAASVRAAAGCAVAAAAALLLF